MNDRLPRPGLIVALDVPTSSSIPPILDRMPDSIAHFKVGLELFTAEGPDALRALVDRHKSVFLDLKLHDIPRTVARAVAAAARLNVTLLTVHASGGRSMLQAAAEAAAADPRRIRLLAVTTLTSLDQSDLSDLGVSRPLNDHTLALGELAVASGIDGIVCSPLEAAEFRRRLGLKPILVTPGIRPAGADAGDQKRIATPRAAVEAGADFLVAGRPILDAPDPGAAAREILRQMLEP